MEFDDVVSRRKSIRSFSNKKVDWKLALKAIEASLESPFAGKLNNLRFIIIEDKSTINKVAELSEQLWISESTMLIAVCSNETNLENMYGERGRVYSRQHAGAAVENLLLKLTDLGLGACWIGSFPDPLIRRLLDIPSSKQIEAIIPLGHLKPEDQANQPKRNISLDPYIRWENWGTKKKPTPYKEPEIKYQ